MDKPTNASPTTDRELAVTRVFDAPPDLVFRMWTDPAHITNWWGPRGFRTTTRAMDFRPGGVWRFVMHGPDGRDYENAVTYVEVDAPRRLVYRHSGEEPGVEPVRFTVTVTLAAEAGGERTRLDMRLTFPSKADRDRVVREYGADQGLHDTVDRLGEQVARVRAGDAGDGPADLDVVSARTFAAPRRRVYEAFADPARLARWWGPAGFATTIHAFDLRPGGAWRMTMRGPDAAAYENVKEFIEIVPGERVVVRHVQPVHRFDMTMTFADDPAGARLTWHLRFQPDPAWPTVRPVIVRANEENFDRLADLLAGETRRRTSR